MNSELPSDYETCSECGFDHEYEYAEAYRAHTKMESVMNMVLVLLLNGDAVCAYPFTADDAKQIGDLREKVRARLRAEGGANMNVRLQVVGVDMPACTPDGFAVALVNDIMDKVST